MIALRAETGTGRRSRGAAGVPRLAVFAAAGALAAVMASGGAVTQAAVRPAATATGNAGRTPAAPDAVLVPAAAAVAAATARTARLQAALTGLQAQAEILAERYDLQTALARQAAAAYRVTAVRLAVARTTERRDSRLLAAQAAADYEADGGRNAAAVMFASAADPQGALGALSIKQAMDGRRVDLLAASQADEIVTRLFTQQAAALLARQRAAARAAGFLRLSVAAAVSRQVSAVRAARASRSRLAARRAAGLATAGTGQATPSGTTPAVLAGGPGGASPGVVAPAWSPDAGASAAQGEVAASWALTQLGRPYQWGAAGPAAYDCSGLALAAWARAGLTLLHWTGFQWVSGPHVPLRQLRPGDLVFYATNIADPATIHHVGISIGGDRMVDAPFTGALVRIDSIYAYAGLIGATRPA